MDERLIAAIRGPAHPLRRRRDRRGGGTARAGADRRSSRGRAESHHRDHRRGRIPRAPGHAALAARPRRRRARRAPPRARRISAASTVDLLQTFAAQSVAAIENARLFGEIEEKSRELVEREPAQVAVPRQYEPRAPHAVERDPGLYRADPRRHLRRRAAQDARGDGARADRTASTSWASSTTCSTCRRSRRVSSSLALARLFRASDMVQGVFAAVEPLASTKGLALKLDVPAGLPQAHGDERRLSQVLLNLVGNAHQIHRCRRDQRSAPRKPTARSPSRSAIPAPASRRPTRQKIFEEFQQADNSADQARRAAPDWGSPSRAASSRCMAGGSGSNSALGKGSTFAVSLPVTVERQVENA